MYLCLCVCVVCMIFLAKGADAKPFVADVFFLACVKGHLLHFEEIQNLLECHLP